MRLVSLLSAFFLIGCSSNGIETKQVSEFEKLKTFCRINYCSATPIAVAVLGGKQELKSYEFAGWVRYDPRIEMNRLQTLEILDRDRQPVCQGGFVWKGWSRSSVARLNCFADARHGKGVFRSHGRQKEGPYKGKGTGTGVFHMENGLLMMFAYGILPEEAKNGDFRKIWLKYGGDKLDLPKVRLKRIEKPPILKPTEFRTAGKRPSLPTFVSVIGGKA